MTKNAAGNAELNNIKIFLIRYVRKRIYENDDFQES